MTWAHDYQPPPKRSWYPKPKGYVVEMQYPWATLGVCPFKHKTLGLDVVIQDNDDGLGVKSRLAWATSGEVAASSPYHLGTIELVDHLPSGSNLAWLPSQIWQEQDGYVVIEAEDIEHHSHWQDRTTGL